MDIKAVGQFLSNFSFVEQLKYENLTKFHKMIHDEGLAFAKSAQKNTFCFLESLLGTSEPAKSIALTIAVFVRVFFLVAAQIGHFIPSTIFTVGALIEAMLKTSFYLIDRFSKEKSSEPEKKTPAPLVEPLPKAEKAKEKDSDSFSLWNLWKYGFIFR